MTLPPFPSQDLAKLVLGYLAEEQLMTAYDEFLQASPYLDALKNEYDRIFMTSLRIILAEYRAVKIYVETCKPFLLRKKLLQCSNILDVVKLLVNYVDVNKLHVQEISSDRNSISKQDASKQRGCDTCDCDTSCTCHNKLSKSISHSAGHLEGSSLETLVETTALEDLPGNSTIKKKHARVLERDSNIDYNTDSGDKQSSSSLNTSHNGLTTHQSMIVKSTENTLSNSAVKVTGTAECREKIEEFNHILHNVCNNKSSMDTRLFSMPEPQTASRRILNTSFQTFASGITGANNRTVSVPDSSTSENSISVLNLVKDIGTVHLENTKEVIDHSELQPTNTYSYPRVKPKCSDQKIKIISDIKVDSPFSTLNNTTLTSTPIMQSIVINGTSAYNQKLPVANSNYTKDEIMAMPTIIVVPTSAPSQKGIQTKPVESQKVKKLKTKTTSSKKLLGPLVIDISSSTVVVPNKKNLLEQPARSLKSLDTGLVKTVDITKNASVPKDIAISGTTQTNTPEGAPPMRKSSSTPRRNSHIRVLDFTTPRRILCDTVPEETSGKSVEVIVAGSSNIVYPETSTTKNIIDISNVQVHKIETCHVSNVNQVKVSKKKNWDADLRALAVSENNVQSDVKASKEKKSKNKQKSETALVKSKEKNYTELKKSHGKRKLSPKAKKSKRRKLEEEEEQYINLVKPNDTNVAVKPTFNIVAANTPKEKQENTKITDVKNKSHDEETGDTPEIERLSLQNEIGAKLNISDLLETPYKQALYDIQMETPKFLGSVLPDEPISDIKIMSIPTPRFFDTPKPTQATPTYSSRGTDYSSGGSYYKPDEQDYLRIPDLEGPITSSIELPKADTSKGKVDDNGKKKERPVRKCTKNVSYRGQIKSKSIDDKAELASSFSDTTSVNSSIELIHETLKPPKTPRATKPKSNLKSETKKKKDSNTRSPIKKDKSNTFMKIKPRRPTPIKDNKRSRKSIALLAKSPKSNNKRKSGRKENSVKGSHEIKSAPTKSRRKSSTPRKLHCSKQFNSESSVDSPEMTRTCSKTICREQTFGTTQGLDSDTEQLALRWSDDGSQDSKPRATECEDISKIKEYIESSLRNHNDYKDGKGTLQVDLIKRGFDAETAKIIERDLLDTPDLELNREAQVPVIDSRLENKEKEPEKTSDENIGITVTELQTENEPSEDDLELSVYECNEESKNYISCISDTTNSPKGNPVTLRDAWSMEVCIDDDMSIRLRATSFNSLFDNEPQSIGTGYSYLETEVAVNSISNMDTLYTPLKDRRSQCYEIFDSTLTSLDTPLKLGSPKGNIYEATEIEIVVEEEHLDSKDRYDTDSKIIQSQNSNSPKALNEVNINNPETNFSFDSTNIQNIDIETVLKKLHGT